MTRTISQRKREFTCLQVFELGKQPYYIGLPDKGVQLKAVLFERAPRTNQDNRRGLLLNHSILTTICM